MDNSVEVRYAGVVVGRGIVRELPPDGARADGVFVGVPEPLPVGTLVTLKMGDVVREARVDDVVESAEPSAVGMRVRWGGAAPAARQPAAAKSEPAAPVREAAAATENGAVVAADSWPAPTGESGAIAAVEAAEEGSGAISAPLSLASPTGDGQHGGKKRRRRR